MDHDFRRQGIDPAALSPLDRLAWLGTGTMGALTYHPPRAWAPDDSPLDLYALGRNAADVLAGETAEILPQLMRTGGSPGGARPKVLVGLWGERILSGEEDLPDGFEHWMVKFTGQSDPRDGGPTEYAYSCMARAAGIEMPPTKLLEVKHGSNRRSYFAVCRFDRAAGNRRSHVHTFAGLLHVNFRIPQSDYADLLKVTRSLTQNHADVLRLFRLMVFNLATHNRDDHARNFAFVLDPNTGEWALTPAYDLTFAMGPGGKHSTTLAGEGRAPSRQHCLKLAGPADIAQRAAETIFEEVNAAVARWPQFAADADCTRKTTASIRKMLVQV